MYNQHQNSKYNNVHGKRKLNSANTVPEPKGRVKVKSQAGRKVKKGEIIAYWYQCTFNEFPTKEKSISENRSQRTQQEAAFLVIRAVITSFVTFIQSCMLPSP